MAVPRKRSVLSVQSVGCIVLRYGCLVFYNISHCDITARRSLPLRIARRMIRTSTGCAAVDAWAIGTPSLVVRCSVSPGNPLAMRSVLKLAAPGRFSYVPLLCGHQTRGIAHVGSIEALAKVTVAGCSRDVLLFLAAQLSMIALSQGLQTIL